MSSPRSDKPTLPMHRAGGQPPASEPPPKKRSRKWFVFFGLIAVIAMLGYWVWMDPGRRAIAIKKANEWGLQKAIAWMKDSSEPIPGPVDTAGDPDTTTVPPLPPLPPVPPMTVPDTEPEPGPGPAVSPAPEPAPTPAAPSPDPNKARAAVELAKAEAFFETEKFDRALGYVERAIALDPKDKAAPRLKKQIVAAKRRADKAAVAAQALRLDEARKRAAAQATAEANLEAAKTFLETGQFAQARKLVGKARAAAPEHVGALELLVEIQKAEMAAAKAAEAKRRAHDSDEAKKKAEEKARAAAALAASSKAEAYVSTGRIMLKADDPKKAAELALKAAEIDPGNAGARKLLADAQAALDATRKRKADRAAALAAKRRSVELKLAEARALLAKRAFPAAEARGKEALAIDPGSAEARVFLAQLEAEKAKAEREAALAQASAADRAKAAERERAKKETARRHLAVAAVYYEKDDLDRASTMTQRALEVNPGSADGINMVGKIAARRKQLAAKVIADAEAAKKLKAAEEARRKAEREKDMELALDLAKRKAELEKAMADADAAEEARKKALEAERLKAEEAARLRADEEARIRAAAEAKLKAEAEARAKAEEDARRAAAAAATRTRAVSDAVTKLDRAFELEDARSLELAFAREAAVLAAKEKANAEEFFKLASGVRTKREGLSVEMGDGTAKVKSRWTISYRMSGQDISVTYSCEMTLTESAGEWKIASVTNTRQR